MMVAGTNGLFCGAVWFMKVSKTIRDCFSSVFADAVLRPGKGVNEMRLKGWGKGRADCVNRGDSIKCGACANIEFLVIHDSPLADREHTFLQGRNDRKNCMFFP